MRQLSPDLVPDEAHVLLHIHSVLAVLATRSSHRMPIPVCFQRSCGAGLRLIRSTTMPTSALVFLLLTHGSALLAVASVAGANSERDWIPCRFEELTTLIRGVTGQMLVRTRRYSTRWWRPRPTTRASRSLPVRRDDLLIAASIDPRIYGQGAWCMLHGGCTDCRLRRMLHRVRSTWHGP